MSGLMERSLSMLAQTLDEKDAINRDLLAALKSMVASYDGIRDALTCPTVIAKLAAADAAIAKAEGNEP